MTLQEKIIEILCQHGCQGLITGTCNEIVEAVKEAIPKELIDTNTVETRSIPPTTFADAWNDYRSEMLKVLEQ